MTPIRMIFTKSPALRNALVGPLAFLGIFWISIYRAWILDIPPRWRAPHALVWGRKFTRFWPFFNLAFAHPCPLFGKEVYARTWLGQKCVEAKSPKASPCCLRVLALKLGRICRDALLPNLQWPNLLIRQGQYPCDREGQKFGQILDYPNKGRSD